MATKVGVQIQPQGLTVDALRRAWRAADDLGADSIWLWDHFFPVFGDPDADHFECYTLLSVMAVDTSRADIGLLVTANSYRNPNLVADVVRTIDHLSGGRAILGIGSGIIERDYEEYGYPYGTARSRLDDLGGALPVIKERLGKLHPGPVGRLPILVGGGGEKVTLRLVARYADMWNGFGPPEEWGRKSRVLDERCDEIGRDRAAVERTASLDLETAVEQAPAFVEQGAEHLIVMLAPPYDLDVIARVRTALEE
jgi:probable F420-dependent oxidoreductase